MKKCLQCEQVYGDETNFCLSDGSTLVSISGSFASPGETPTVYRQDAAPTVYVNPEAPPSYNTPFATPVSNAQTAPEKSNALLIVVVVGLFALLALGALAGLVIYGLNSAGKKDTNVIVSNTGDKSNKNTERDNDNLAENLKQQQEKIDKDRQKLEDERKRLEEKKKQTTPSPTPSNATTAVIIDPPSNVRSSPNGSVICVLQRRGTVVNILGSTGISDNNGTWYYTDACGKQGVIHSSQIRF